MNIGLWESLIILWLAFQLPIGIYLGKTFKEKASELEAPIRPYGQGNSRDVAGAGEVVPTH